MKALILLTFLAGALAYSVGQDKDKASAVCESLCGNCGGLGSLLQDVCVCKIPHSDGTKKQCCERAKLRASYLDLGWRIDESLPEMEIETPNQVPALKTGRLRRFLDSRTNDFKGLSTLSRIPRSVQPMNGVFHNVGFYGAPVFGQNHAFLSQDIVRPYRSDMNGPEAGGMYEIIIGNSGEDAVQLVFPHSDGLEVEHQYIYQGADGVEHPCSDAVSSKDIMHSDEYNPDRGSWEHWEGGPDGFGDSRHSEESLENQNAPIYPREREQHSYRSQENYHGGNDEGWTTDGSDGGDGEKRWSEFSEEEDEKDSYELVKETYSEEMRRHGMSEEISNDGYKYEERRADYGTASMSDFTRPWDRNWEYTTSPYRAF